MNLSSTTVDKLSQVLAPEAINYIHEDDRYGQFMIEVISDFLREQMGQMDDELQVELTYKIMDYIFFTSK